MHPMQNQNADKAIKHGMDSVSLQLGVVSLRVRKQMS
jgi:hypothetical protein